MFPTLTDMVSATQESKKPEPKRYGIYCVECPSCKWQNINRIAPSFCEACNTAICAVDSEFHNGPHDVACYIASLSEKITNRLYELAEKQGYFVVKVSERRFMVVRAERSCSTVSYGDKQERAYMTMNVFARGTWQEVMKYLRDNTPDLPDYLKRGN